MRLTAVVRWLSGPTTFRALANRRFTLVWGSQTLSRIGDFLYEIAIAWWVLEQTGSAAAMASLLIVSFAPTLLFLLVGGVAVDRFSRVRIMLLSDVLRGSIASSVAVLAALDLLQLWHLYVLNLSFGIVDAFFQPAYAAAMPDLVCADDLPSANALSSMSTQAGRIAGPALAAAIVALGGTPLAFALNGLSFFLAAAMLAPLLGLPASRPTPPARDGAASPSVLAELREGLGTILSTPWLWSTILLFALSNLTLGGPYSVALPVLVHEHMGAEVSRLGLLTALFASGYVAGGIWLGRSAQLRRRGRLIYGGVAVAGLTLGVFGLPAPIHVKQTFVCIGTRRICTGTARHNA
ncbi:MAG: MFS transporter [Chloroflexales bacterium]|nr:MFS transporter [Chloroflexales bacterium]